jgi:hypothetical protein
MCSFTKLLVAQTRARRRGCSPGKPLGQVSLPEWLEEEDMKIRCASDRFVLKAGALSTGECDR